MYCYFPVIWLVNFVLWPRLQYPARRGYIFVVWAGVRKVAYADFRAEKRSAQAFAHPLSQAQGGLFCVLTVCRQFVCLSLREFWLTLNEMHKVWTFASRKALLLLCGFCFSSLENYFGLATTNVKGKTDHPSLWGGIKSFELVQRGEYFSDCSFDLFVSWFRLLSPGWIKTHFFFISKYFFTCPDLFPLQNQLYPSLQSKNHFVHRKTFSEIEGQ